MKLNDLARVTWQDGAQINTWATQVCRAEVKYLTETHIANEEQRWEDASLIEESRSQEMSGDIIISPTPNHWSQFISSERAD